MVGNRRVCFRDSRRSIVTAVVELVLPRLPRRISSHDSKIASRCRHFKSTYISMRWDDR
jgi:hypothetical protein